MSLKSRPIAFVKLHRIHAAAQATRVEFGSELGDMHWRGEGGEKFREAKEAVAFRLATCWNVLEGIPTKVLLDGFVRDVFAAAEDGDFTTAQEMISELDERMDWTNGRAHDCAACLGREDTDDGDAEAA